MQIIAKQEFKAGNKRYLVSALCFAIFIIGLSLIIPQAKASAAAVQSTLNLSVDNYITVYLSPSASGTFGEETGAIRVWTNNYTGYTLSIEAENSTDLIGIDNSNNVIQSISSPITESAFSSNSSYNNKWGYKPSRYNDITNDDTFYPSPSTNGGDLLAITNMANSGNPTVSGDFYNITVGARVDYSQPADIYTNSFIITAVANSIAYNLYYNENAPGTINNMPTSPQGSTITGGTAAANSKATLSSNIPTRTGYTFAGWCDVVTTNNMSTGNQTCPGNTYQAGADFGIDQTADETSINLYAIWHINTYSITIATSTGISNITVKRNGETICSTNSTTGTVCNLTYSYQYNITATTASGYTFSSWSADAGTIGNSSSATTTYTVADNDATLTASTTAKTYTITLNGNGATTAGSTSATATYNSTTLSTITNPSRSYTISGFTKPAGNNADGATVSSTSTLTSNYTFNGWYKESGTTNKIASNATTPVLQANTSYTDSNGKWTNDGAVTLYAGWTGQAKTLPTITKTGYNCGWTTTSTGATSITYASGGSLTPTSNTTLYGVCIAKTYTITLNKNGATNSPTTSTTATYNATTLAAIATLPTRSYTISGFTKPAGNNADGATVSSTSTLTSTYTFNGWYKESGATNKIASNASTPALQASTSYTDANSKWTNDGAVTLYAGWTGQAKTLPTITKTGYTCGWTETSTGATTITYASGSSLTPTKNYTLYGVCTAKTYTITLNKNGATNSPTTSTTATYNATTLAAIATLPTRSHTISGFTKTTSATNSTVSATTTLTSTYTFNGWYKESGATNKIASNASTPALQASTSYTDANSNWTNDGAVTLYAGWTGQAKTLPTITRTGSTCGWSTSSSATTITYNSGASLTPTGNITLYGVCVTNITLNNAGATTTGSTSATVNFNATALSSITLPQKKYTVSGFTVPSGNNASGATVSSTSTLTGTYTLNGWYTASSGGTKIAAGGSDTTPDLQASTTYTNSSSQWTYTTAGTITLYSQWSNANAAVTLPTITKTGFDCGWTTTSSGATTITYASGGSLTPSANTTLYGVCIANTYSLAITFAGVGVSSVQVRTASGASGGTLMGTVSTSGGSVSGLAYGTNYYLYPTFTDENELQSWAKTDSATNSSLSSTTALNPYYKIGAGNGAVTITGTDCIGGKICYKANASDTTGTMGKQTVSATATSIALIPSNYSRSNYGFIGWNTQANGAGTSYGPNQTIEFEAGTYTDHGLALYAMWIQSAGNMQSWTGCNDLASGDITALKDTRDNQVYAVAKLADGKCWMIENLRLGTTGSNDSTKAQGFGGVFTGLADPETANFANNTTSNTLSGSTYYGVTGSGAANIIDTTTHTVSSTDYSGYAFPRFNNNNTASRASSPTGGNASIYEYGNYYTWAAAKANTDHFANATTSNAQSTSICPSSWRLPTGTGSGDFGVLSNSLGGYQNASGVAQTMTSSTTPTGKTMSATLRSFPQNFVYAGWIENASISSRNTSTRYWTSTANNNSNAYLMIITATSINPGNTTIGKFIGASVRCVIPVRYTITLNANGGTASTSTTVEMGSTTLDGPITNPTRSNTVSSRTISGFTLTTSATGATVSSTNHLTMSNTTSYTFNGWRKTSSASSALIASNATTPVLQASTDYTDANGKWTSSSNQTLYAGWTSSSTGWSTVVLPTITRAGSTCGWSTSSSATTITYASGASFGYFSNMPANLPLYGVCVINKYTIVFDGNGATNATTGMKTGSNYTVQLTNITEGDEVELLASNYYKSGYGFAGWSFDSTAQPGGSATIYGPNEAIVAPAATTANETKVLYAIWVASSGAIQNWTGCSSMNIGDVTALTDSRDSNVYTVGRLADGKCWMMENLRLNSANSANSTLAEGFGGVFDGLANPETNTFTSSTTSNSKYSTSNITGNNQGSRFPRYNESNISNPITNPTYVKDYSDNSEQGTYPDTNVYLYGNYYTWAAAAANTENITVNNTTAHTSICPTGWRLPEGGDKNNEINNEYWELIVDKLNNGVKPANYNNDNNPYYTGDTEAVPISKLIRQYPNNFTYPGYYNASTPTYRGSYGGYLTSTVSGSMSSYFLRLTKSDVRPGSWGTERYYGYSARCVANNYITYHPNGSNVQGAMGKQMAYSNQEVQLIASNFSRSGYGFAGWSTDPNAQPGGTSTIYGPNETITTASNFNSTGLDLYAVWVQSAGTIQNWTGCNGMSIGSVTALTDSRDNNVYTVGKLADGSCWMMENLRLDAANSTNSSLSQGFGGVFSGLANSEQPTNFANVTTANSKYSTTNITGDNQAFRFPRYNNTNTASSATSPTSGDANFYSYGNYYTWAAAMANTEDLDDVTESEQVKTSICPVGWRLPTGGDSRLTSEYYNLAYENMGTAADDDGVYSESITNISGDTASEALRKYPNNFILSGGINNGSFYKLGNSSYYWTSTANYDVSKTLYFNSSILSSNYGYSKYTGRSVRCVANNYITYHPNGSNVQGTMGKQMAYSNQEVQLIASNFSRSGYGFAGWSTDPNAQPGGSSTIYGPNETITTASNFTSTGLDLYAVWVQSAGNLQNWNGCNSMSSGSVTALTDTRDNNVYTVGKLADGNCWMMENLRLDAANSTNSSLAQGFGGVFTGLANSESANFDEVTTANSKYSTSNITGSNQAYRIPRYNNDNTASRATSPTNGNANIYGYGNYYNWPAAAATTIFGTMHQVSNTSICPAGWRLPTGGTKSYISTSEFWNLIVKNLNNNVKPANYSSAERPYYTNDSNNEATPVAKALRAYPNNFTYAGYFSGSSTWNTQGTAGRYWSATTGTDGVGAMRIIINDNTVTPGTTQLPTYNATSVRCINSTLHNKVASLTKGTQTVANLKAVITVPTSSDPTTDTSNSGVYTYNSSSSVFGTASDMNNDYPIYYFRGVLDTNLDGTNSTHGSAGDGLYYPNYVRISYKKNSTTTYDTCWRILRTTGSGGIKLIYNGLYGATTAGSCANPTTAARLASTSAYGVKGNSGQSTYWYRNINRVGYTFNNTSSLQDSTTSTPVGTVFGSTSNYSTTNTTNSNLKTNLETFFNTYLGGGSYDDRFERNAGYCNDRSVYSNAAGSTAITNIVPYASSSATAYFGGYARHLNTGKKPTLACSRGRVDIYSENIYGEDLEGGNYQLSRPIAVPTADELALSGLGKAATYGSTTTYSSNYNYNTFTKSGGGFWTLTPSDRTAAGVTSMITPGSSGQFLQTNVSTAFGLRPTVTLIHDTIINGGAGTATNPWLIKYGVN